MKNSTKTQGGYEEINNVVYFLCSFPAAHPELATVLLPTV